MTTSSALASMPPSRNARVTIFGRRASTGARKSLILKQNAEIDTAPPISLDNLNILLLYYVHDDREDGHERDQDDL